MQILPFKPYPGFDWIMLGLCGVFSIVTPEAAILSLIWFGFAIHHLCNLLSMKMVNKPFVITSKHSKNEGIHPVGLILLVPYFLGVVFCFKAFFQFSIFLNNLLF